jgi:ribosomal protein L22
MSTSDPDKKPPRRRRRSKGDADAPDDAAARPEDATAAEDETTRAASSSEATAESSPDEVEPTPADVEAEEAAADVMLEADEEAEQPADEEAEEPEADAADEEAEEPAAEGEEAPAPTRRRRRRGAAAAEETAAPTPAPTRRRRAQRDPNLPPPVVRAHAKYVRSSARKARLVCDHIRGKTVEEARAILAHTPRAVARDWSKLLESAVANAEHNHELVGEDLYIKAVKADEGPTIKRFQPRAMGRATKIRKRTAHLTILLTPKD